MKDLLTELIENYNGPRRNGHVLTEEIERKIVDDLEALDLEYRKEQAEARAARRNVILI